MSPGNFITNLNNAFLPGKREFLTDLNSDELFFIFAFALLIDFDLPFLAQTASLSSPLFSF
jgi:hypothetical protein